MGTSESDKSGNHGNPTIKGERSSRGIGVTVTQETRGRVAQNQPTMRPTCRCPGCWVVLNNGNTVHRDDCRFR